MCRVGFSPPLRLFHCSVSTLHCSQACGGGGLKPTLPPEKPANRQILPKWNHPAGRFTWASALPIGSPEHSQGGTVRRRSSRIARTVIVFLGRRATRSPATAKSGRSTRYTREASGFGPDSRGRPTGHWYKLWSRKGPKGRATSKLRAAAVHIRRRQCERCRGSPTSHSRHASRHQPPPAIAVAEAASQTRTTSVTGRIHPIARGLTIVLLYGIVRVGPAGSTDNTSRSNGAFPKAAPRPPETAGRPYSRRSAGRCSRPSG